jgi:hypothetical protein
MWRLEMWRPCVLCELRAILIAGLWRLEISAECVGQVIVARLERGRKSRFLPRQAGLTAVRTERDASCVRAGRVRDDNGKTACGIAACRALSSATPIVWEFFAAFILSSGRRLCASRQASTKGEWVERASGCGFCGWREKWQSTGEMENCGGLV